MICLIYIIDGLLYLSARPSIFLGISMTFRHILMCSLSIKSGKQDTPLVQPQFGIIADLMFIIYYCLQSDVMGYVVVQTQSLLKNPRAR